MRSVLFFFFKFVCYVSLRSNKFFNYFIYNSNSSSTHKPGGFETKQERRIWSNIVKPDIVECAVCVFCVCGDNGQRQ